jgi:hypothetical protein
MHASRSELSDAQMKMVFVIKAPPASRYMNTRRHRLSNIGVGQHGQEELRGRTNLRDSDLKNEAHCFEGLVSHGIGRKMCEPDNWEFSFRPSCSRRPSEALKYPSYQRFNWTRHGTHKTYSYMIARYGTHLFLLRQNPSFTL